MMRPARGWCAFKSCNMVDDKVSKCKLYTYIASYCNEQGWCLQVEDVQAVLRQFSNTWETLHYITCRVSLAELMSLQPAAEPWRRPHPAQCRFPEGGLEQDWQWSAERTRVWKPVISCLWQGVGFPCSQLHSGEKYHDSLFLPLSSYYFVYFDMNVMAGDERAVESLVQGKVSPVSCLIFTSAFNPWIVKTHMGTSWASVIRCWGRRENMLALLSKIIKSCRLVFVSQFKFCGERVRIIWQGDLICVSMKHWLKTTADRKVDQCTCLSEP